MKKITDAHNALRLIKHYGYLNQFSTPADSWFETSDVRMGQDDLARLIDDDVAEELIRAGKVVEVERGHPDGGGNSTWAVCYRPA